MSNRYTTDSERRAAWEGLARCLVAEFDQHVLKVLYCKNCGHGKHRHSIDHRCTVPSCSCWTKTEEKAKEAAE